MCYDRNCSEMPPSDPRFLSPSCPHPRSGEAGKHSVQQSQHQGQAALSEPLSFGRLLCRSTTSLAVSQDDNTGLATPFMAVLSLSPKLTPTVHRGRAEAPLEILFTHRVPKGCSTVECSQRLLHPSLLSIFSYPHLHHPHTAALWTFASCSTLPVLLPSWSLEESNWRHYETFQSQRSMGLERWHSG